MSDELTQKSIGSFVWKTLQSVCSLGITFIIQLVLARMLMPEDFGLIAIVNVFMTLANTIIETSFSSAIIQREKLSEKMLSSLFYLNIILSFTIYVVLFFVAPLLADFYREPILVYILRVQGISVVISAVYSVQLSLMNRKMRFKALFFCYLAGGIVQAFVGIIMAYRGMGIWSLVVSTCVGSTVTGLSVMIIERWKPEFCFCFGLVKSAAGFSSKILAIRVVKKIYYNIRVLVIGKVYNAEVLGYFNKGFQFPSTAMTIVDGSLTSVSFTHLSKLQNDQKNFINSLRQYIRYAMFLTTPIMVGMALIARPLVLFLLTERWIDCVPYLQIVCLSQLFVPLSIKMTAFESLGRSDISMKLNLTGIILSIALLFAFLNFDPLVMVFGAVISNAVLQVLVAIVVTKKLQYSIFEQLKDALCGVLPTVAMCCAVVMIGFVDFNNYYWLEVLVKFFVGLISFALVSLITKNSAFRSMIKIINDVLRRKKDI